MSLQQATQPPSTGELLLRLSGCIGKPGLAWGRERLSNGGGTFMTGNFLLYFERKYCDNSISEKNGRLPYEQNSPTRICVEPILIWAFIGGAESITLGFPSISVMNCSPFLEFSNNGFIATITAIPAIPNVEATF